MALQDSNAKLQAAQDKYKQALNALQDSTLAAEEKNNKVAGLQKEAEQLKSEALQVQELEAKLAEFQNGDKGGNAADFNQQDIKADPFDVEVKQTGSQFKTLTGFTRAVTKAGQKGATASKNLKWFSDSTETASTHEQKDLAENIGASGGFLVPTEQFMSLMAVVGESSIIRPRATIIRMRRRQVNIPVLDQTGTTAGKAHWFGGMTVYWTEEAAAKSTTDPSFRQISLIAHKMAALTRVSDELLDDAAVSLTDFLMGPMGFAGAVSFMEDYAFLQGDGAGKPQGILNAPCAITVAREVQASVTYGDVVTMLEKFLPSGNGIWIASQTLLSNLLQMTGPSGNPSYVWGPGPMGQTAIPGIPGTLLGRPIIFTEKSPVVSTTSVGDLMLVDPRYYLVGDRQATTLASTIYEKFANDQTTFRVVHRVDGQAWLSAPLTGIDGTVQYSPFVILGAKTTS